MGKSWEALGLALFVGVGALTSSSVFADDKPILRVGGFDPATVELTNLSGVFSDAPYVIEPSSASFGEQAAALNAGTIDIARYGATTAFRQQANETPQWTVETSPIKLIAGFAPPPNREVPKVATIVRTDANINAPEDFKGKTWAFSVGGDTPTVYLASLDRAGLAEGDIETFENDASGATFAAFRAGQAQAVTGFTNTIFDLIASGEAKVFYSSDELGIAVFPGFATLTASLQDPNKEPLIRDFLVRYNKYITGWYDANPDKVRDVLIRVSQFSPELADFTIKQNHGTRSINFNEALYSGVRKSATLLAGAGDIKPIEDIEATFDGRYNELLGSVDYAY